MSYTKTIANSMHIVVTVDASTYNALMISIIEYQQGWSECLNIHYVAEARFFEKKTVRMSINSVH